MPATATQTTRSLALFSPFGNDVLLLRRFHGREQFSDLFEYELDMLAEDDSLDPRSIVGKNVTWRVDRNGEAVRYFNGYVAQFNQAGATERFTRYRCQVVPWLWFLTQTTDSRIFQRKTTPEIVETVFRDLGFRDFESRLAENYQPREYCVQYRETDFHFVSRLLEEEGIFYYFQHDNGEHRLVLADRPTAYDELADGNVQLAAPGHTAGIVDQLKDWSHRCSFRPGRVALNDYNFTTPATKINAAEETIRAVGKNSQYELYDYPSRYEHRAAGERFARIAMEEQEAQLDVVEGSSSYRSFTPGGRFRVAGHRIEDEIGRRYVITGVETQASVKVSYETANAESEEPEFENRFTCIDDSVAYRPERKTPKAIVEGPQTAVVVGPPGEEIFTDEYGRVKVQFHWDREGRFNEDSSCWVRVSQTHAGSGWGAIDLPRIGEEVIVSFLDGDPDRPIIKGRTYNAEAMPPFALPGGMTRSGMKSNTHKGSGYNEISLDDTAGKEQLRTGAQYNMDTTVGNNQTLEVGVDRSADIGNNDTLAVGVDSSTEVGNDQATTVGNNSDTIVGNRVVIEAGTAITLACGASTIHMNQAGVITISGNFVTSAAKACNSIVAPLTNITGSTMLNQAGLICLDVGGYLHVKGSKTAVKGLATRVNAGKVVVKGTPIKIGDADMAKVVVPPVSSNGSGDASGSSSKSGKRPLTRAEYERYQDKANELNQKYEDLRELEQQHENGELSDDEFQRRYDDLEKEKDAKQRELDKLRNEIDWESVEWDENEQPKFPDESNEAPESSPETPIEIPGPKPNLPGPVTVPPVSLPAPPTPIPSPTPPSDPSPNQTEPSAGMPSNGGNSNETHEACSGAWIEGPGIRNVGVGSIDFEIANQDQYPGHVWIKYRLRGEYYGTIKCNCKKSGEKEIKFSWKFDESFATLYNAQFMLPGLGWLTMLIRIRKLFKADRIIQENKKYIRAGLKVLEDSADLICKGAFNPRQLLDVFPKYIPPGMI